jgi:anti-sigma factor RsiW
VRCVLRETKSLVFSFFRSLESPHVSYELSCKEPAVPMSVKGALAGLGAGAAAVALLAAVTLTASVRSSTLLDNTAPFQPWQETPWSGRATQGLDAQGQDW